jgi:aspartyl-tRNA(Asn)/glutamyl-tRNA(Gln) amidotransferase subunit A
LARTAEDCALVLDAIAGYDPEDFTSRDRPIDTEPMSGDLKGVRLALPREFFYAQLHPEVRDAVDDAISVLTALGAEIRDVPLEVDADRTVFRAEAFAHHARYIADAPSRYLPETLAKLRSGANIQTSEYNDARRRLAESRRAMKPLFSEIDCLITPTTPVPAPRLSDYPATFEGVLALEASSILRNTRPFNTYGIPAITVPCGLTQAGLPIGLHIAGPPWRERLTLAVALAFQSATDWHTRVPPLLRRL